MYGGIKKDRIFRRFMCLLISAIFIFSFRFPVLAATKTVPSRVIGIVFDNSGSMYVDFNNNQAKIKAWCQATYAMEVFASMMNSKDTLIIYPMNEITIDGKSYTYNSPYIMQAGADTSVIRRIQTVPANGDTPIESIINASLNMAEQSGEEKWLIVLTDGDVFQQADANGKLVDLPDTQASLSEVLGYTIQGMNVMYLKIGTGASMPIVNATDYKYISDQASNSEDVLGKLTGMSNAIFGRNAVNYEKDSELSFDIPMSKLIVFAQGKNINDLKLINNDSGENYSAESTASPKYSEASSVGEVDNSLSGEIASFSNCEAGNYTISYNGDAASVGVYYEPDVDVAVQLIDKNGNIMDEDAELYAGDYLLRYGLADKDGIFTKSSLLGSTNYAVNYSMNGSNQPLITGNEPGEVQISLKAGDTIDDLKVTADYLDGYHIEKNGNDLDWWKPGGLKFELAPYEFDANITGGAEEYNISAISEEAMYDVSLVYNGVLLTGDSLKNTTLAASSEGLETEIELDEARNCYTVKLNNNGNSELEKGNKELVFYYTYKDASQNINATGKATREFIIKDDSKKFKLNVKAPQNYYQISQIPNGKPVVAEITYNGNELTPEQFSHAKLEIEPVEGLEYEVTPDPDNSRFNIIIKNGDAGKYSIKAKATLDNVPNAKLEDKTSIKLAVMPRWFKLLIVLIALAVLITIIVLIMSMKVLPKKAPLATEIQYMVGGKTVEGDVELKFIGLNKKEGSMGIGTPDDPNNGDAAKMSINMKLSAIHKRFKKSKDRRFKVKSITFSDNIKTASILGKDFARNRNDEMIMEDSETTEFAPFDVTNNNIELNGNFMNTNAKTVNISITFDLNYR